jgi:hypothetical protein
MKRRTGPQQVTGPASGSNVAQQDDSRTAMAGSTAARGVVHLGEVPDVARLFQATHDEPAGPARTRLQAIVRRCRQ